jgi:phosphoribosylformylglycinamidine synthase
MGSPNIASRRWICEQYDQQVGGDTVQRPGGDAAVVRVHGSKKALAMTTDVTPRYCYADPYEGGKQAIAEAYRNLCAVGAKPLAVTNCLNFGNPQRPEIMAQFVECLRGMGDACRALDFPIVSGNVSLYNESKATGGGSAILPTPAIGGVGLLDDWEKSATIGFRGDGEHVMLVGSGEGHLGSSLWLKQLHDRSDGAPPPVDLHTERKTGEFIRQLIADGTLTAVHDISDGGLAVALAEMALAGSRGADVAIEVRGPGNLAANAFGEDQAMYLVTTKSDSLVKTRAKSAGVDVDWIGTTGGDALRLKYYGASPPVMADIPLAELRAAHEGFLPQLMSNELAPAA